MLSSLLVAVLVFLVFVGIRNVSRLHSVLHSVLEGNSDGACNNPADIKVFHDHWYDFRSIVQSCAQDCLGRSNCTSRCIQNDTGLSEGCSDCFGDTVECIASKCFVPCLKPESNDCQKCALDNCLPALLKCTGCDYDEIQGKCKLPPAYSL